MLSEEAGKKRVTAANGAALEAAAAGEWGADIGEAPEAILFVLSRSFFAFFPPETAARAAGRILPPTATGVPTMRKEGLLFLAIRISRDTLCHFTAWGHTRTARKGLRLRVVIRTLWDIVASASWASWGRIVPWAL